MNPNNIKTTFGKRYIKPISPFQKFYGTGFEGEFTERNKCIDTWNACLWIAKDRLRMYGQDAASELLDILFEED